MLDDTLIGIENLNSGYLTHRILDPQVLTKYLEIIEDNLEQTAPEYELVFTSVYQYYGNSLASLSSIISRYLVSTCGSNIQWVKYPEFKFSIPINVSSNTDSYLIYCL